MTAFLFRADPDGHDWGYRAQNLRLKMQKTMEHEMATGFVEGYAWVWVGEGIEGRLWYTSMAIAMLPGRVLLASRSDFAAVVGPSAPQWF